MSFEIILLLVLTMKRSDVYHLNRQAKTYLYFSTFRPSVTGIHTGLFRSGKLKSRRQKDEGLCNNTCTARSLRSFCLC